MDRRYLWAFLCFSSVLLSAAFIGLAKARPAEQPAPAISFPTLSPAPPTSRVNRSDNFYSILTGGAVRRADQAKIAKAFAAAYPHPLYQGQRYRLSRRPDSALSEFLLWSKNGEWEYSMTPSGGGFAFERRPTSFSKYTTALSGYVETSLYAALLAQGEGAELVQQFVDLFSWDVNWFVDPKPGDRFSVVFEKFYHQSEFTGYGRILAAAYVNGSRSVAAYYFAPESSVAGYYNSGGQSMHKTFLKAPLSYSRVSSRFNPGRRHPILHSIRAHTGVDYAAPSGTPVKAAADGRVTAKEYRGGLGNCVILAHGNGYSTTYGHLSGFARSISSGKNVRQGDVVGYVGATGLATGPHLHYQLSRHGRTLDPLKAEFPSVNKIPEPLSRDFEALKERFRRRLNLDDPLYANR